MGELPSPHVLLVGAHFACPACLRRGIARVCAHCGSGAVDLERDEGAAFLKQALLTGVIEPNRASFARWWGRRTKWDRVEWIVAALGGLAMIVGVLATSGPSDGSSRLLVIPFYFLFTILIRLITFLGGLLLRLFLVLLLLVSSLVIAIVEHLARSEAGYAAKVLESLPKLLDFGARGRWTSEPSQPSQWPSPSLEGTLLRVSDESSSDGETLNVRRFLGKKGDMSFGDALVPAFELRTTDGEIVRVELDVGGVVASGVATPSPERATIELGASNWLSDATEHEASHIASGARVTLSGGAWSEVESSAGGGEDFRHAPRIRVVRGTSDEPLWVDFTRRD